MIVYSELSLKGKKAKDAAYKLGSLSSQVKNKALEAMAYALVAQEEEILAANALDMEAGRQKGMSKALLDRLMLNKKRIEEMAEGLYALVSLPDPIGEVKRQWRRPNGLEIGQVRVPLGVVGIIYEARPNVTVDAAGLCLKTGNAVILRGGSEAIRSNMAIVKAISKASEEAGIPEGAIQLVEDSSREVAQQMMTMNEYLDVLIPRGGAGLIQAVVKNATVPVIETGVGNCHIYVDADADLEMAEKIIINAKCQRPGVCNAAESLLVHQDVARKFIPHIGKVLTEMNVELRGCPRTLSLFSGIKEATDEDYATEFLDLILAVKIVDSFDEALEHIRKYSTGHSEAIVTRDYSRAREFTRRVDAAAVYVNASTRFTDGFQFGMGAEIGISTQKLHARGPMGLNELTTIKYVCYGDGQIR
ncbi:gamma-glutamyl phosphate reductase [Heliomicrobium modesticaldum Ice1]|uniref:Gamma-glutamyl phosphate reductase n=1 Tax=Heliobacterium modesticaldum (strain ATCC 51547 / Ice1) TaxID=498761 RepID=PROA_HELMI|nr:glutamate-5-semialdehyde dehydrogenase [Heliomicrobium modesticaldum]B0TBV8.1 RecName: Full=Gamma-glutamyl phosphate reductase; Short=GPR; AltName: Full=Glutamate-5-semialdehyde dehydrogenase; AltName: Full=Glutamyl-gamma-semialdehyde dehydrogenase; Short=GSA dehydrogenase [Heliomicrobium modesticaldum Ice1]ABZ85231.1 gamma-glutamyl phosphate reductase [Heliomicrobium modesticaldum Ice1]